MSIIFHFGAIESEISVNERKTNSFHPILEGLIIAPGSRYRCPSFSNRINTVTNINETTQCESKSNYWGVAR